jgi:hypothetical protein
MPLGVNRTDANVPPNTTYRNGTPITLPHNFGNVVDWDTPDPTHFGNPIPSDGNEVNTVDWQTPDPAHFGNTVAPAEPTQATPTFDPIAGTYEGGQLITITSAGADAIYYTEDGSTPTTGSTHYTSPVDVEVPGETIKAIAVKAGYNNSAVGSATYVITAPAGIALLAHAAAVTGASPVAGPIDTTGASLIVAVIGTVVTLGTPPITDSNNNTWQLLTVYGNNSSTNPTVQIAYAYNPTVGAGHTFTGHGVNGTSIEVAAFSNTKIDASVFVAGSDKGVANAQPPVQPGSVSPSTAGDLVVTGYVNHGAGSGPALIDSSFTITDGNEAGFGFGALAYLITTTGSAVNPSWTVTTPGDVFDASAAIAIFESVNDPS